MISFSYPLFSLLLLLPFVLFRLLPSAENQIDVIKVPWFKRTLDIIGQQTFNPEQGQSQSWWKLLIAFMCWVSLVAALCRPQWIDEPLEMTIPTRDLLLLVDLSGSMETEDFMDESGKIIDRLSAVKQVLGDFLVRREGDRVGLVVFGNAAFVQVPFTRDLEVSRILLNETAARMAGPKTALGDAIGLGINLFKRSEVSEKVIVALTDGNDTGSKVLPIEAARIAKENGIVIYMVGVGDPQSAGEAKMDEASLKSIASVTGGQYYHANDRIELEQIYDTLDQLSTREVKTLSHRPKHDLFYWPLFAFLVLSISYVLIEIFQIFISSGLRSMRSDTRLLKEEGEE